MIQIADMVADVIEEGGNAIKSVRERAKALCAKYPLYE